MCLVNIRNIRATRNPTSLDIVTISAYMFNLLKRGFASWAVLWCTWVCMVCGALFEKKRDASYSQLNPNHLLEFSGIEQCGTPSSLSHDFLPRLSHRNNAFPISPYIVSSHPPSWILQPDKRTYLIVNTWPLPSSFYHFTASKFVAKWQKRVREAILVHSWKRSSCVQVKEATTLLSLCTHSNCFWVFSPYFKFLLEKEGIFILCFCYLC